MDNIIFHTQYIKMEIRSLHKGVTQSFHYRAIFYLFHHKNRLFRIFTYQISEERGVDTTVDWKGSVFFFNVIYSNQLWNLTFKTGYPLKGESVYLCLSNEFVFQYPMIEKSGIRPNKTLLERYIEMLVTNDPDQIVWNCECELFKSNLLRTKFFGLKFFLPLQSAHTIKNWSDDLSSILSSVKPEVMRSL